MNEIDVRELISTIIAMEHMEDESTDTEISRLAFEVREAATSILVCAARGVR